MLPAFYRERRNFVVVVVVVVVFLKKKHPDLVNPQNTLQMFSSTRNEMPKLQPTIAVKHFSPNIITFSRYAVIQKKQTKKTPEIS